MATIKLRCQDCGATLEVSEDKDVLFCPYCGHAEMIEESDEIKKERINSSTILKKQRAEIRHDLARQQIRATKEIKKQANEVSFIKLLVSAIGIILVFALIFEACDKIERFGKIESPANSEECIGVSTVIVYNEFLDAGFQNIECVPEGYSDPSDRISGTVVRISINGDSDFHNYNWFKKNAKVSITYDP